MKSVVNMQCVVHYNSLKVSAAIKPLSTDTFATLKENKLARQRLGGDNAHSNQCGMIPDVLDSEVHGAHRKCYQKFSKGISIEKKIKKQKSKKSSRKRPH